MISLQLRQLNYNNRITSENFVTGNKIMVRLRFGNTNSWEESYSDWKPSTESNSHIPFNLTICMEMIKR